MPYNTPELPGTPSGTQHQRRHLDMLMSNGWSKHQCLHLEMLMSEGSNQRR